MSIIESRKLCRLRPSSCRSFLRQTVLWISRTASLSAMPTSISTTRLANTPVMSSCAAKYSMVQAEVPIGSELP